MIKMSIKQSMIKLDLKASIEKIRDKLKTSYKETTDELSDNEFGILTDKVKSKILDLRSSMKELQNLASGLSGVCLKCNVDIYFKYDSYRDIFFVQAPYIYKIVLNEVNATWRATMKRWDFSDIDKVKKFLNKFELTEEFIHFSESAKKELVQYKILVKSDNDRYQEKNNELNT